MRLSIGVLSCAAILAAGQAPAEEASGDAAAFGALPWAQHASLSPDGKHLVFISPEKGTTNVAIVQDLSNGTTKIVTYSDGKPLHLTGCQWSANDRLVCNLYGVSKLDKRNVAWNRVVAVDANGGKALDLGDNDRSIYYGVNAYDGEVVDWLSGEDGEIIMRRFLPSGFVGLERVDTRTGKGEPVKPSVTGKGFYTDGEGRTRITADAGVNNLYQATGVTTYRYSLPGSTDWRPFSKVDPAGGGITPLIVDGTSNVAYGTQKLNGRDALYRIALDGSMKTDLVYADPNVDVDGVETIGRRHRVIGYRYITDHTQIVYFDPFYRTLAASLAKALPKLPAISFESVSADERKLLILASSDDDPGHYYLYDRDTRHLTEALVVRPQLTGRKLAIQTSVTIPAADGTPIPAYLTLPPGGAGKNLPAIVMPHGGPASRDVWGFDWLPQFFAARGYAVLQPEFRGSTGFGEDFEKGSGFKSWRAAVGDVVDSAHWLVAKGIAAPGKLAIFGWSYGGYAALQANYLDPGLFKAVVAVAPVTDLALHRDGEREDINAVLMKKFWGDRAEAAEGSPVRHADIFRAPVLMFHGDNDVNVDIADSRAMDKALRNSGKQSRLVVYPGLDHQLNDGDVRADMLTQSDAFITKAIGQSAR